MGNGIITRRFEAQLRLTSRNCLSIEHDVAMSPTNTLRSESMRRLFLMVIIASLFMGFGCTKREPLAGNDRVVRITGRILAANGEAPARAHVHAALLNHIRLSSAAKPTVSVEVAPNGNFSLEVPLNKAVALQFTAADHEMLQVPVYFEREDEVEVEVRLRPNPYVETFETVRIVGLWNDFDFQAADTMVRQKDGTFLWEQEADTSFVSYQLLDITSNYHSVNGTMSERLIYDGGGDYRSVVGVDQGKARIIFDPSLLTRHPGVGLPKFTTNEEYAYLAEILAIGNAAKKMEDDFSRAYRSHVAEGGNLETMNSDRSPVMSRLRKAMSDGTNPWLRRWAALKLLDLSTVTGLVEGSQREDLDVIAEVVPPSSPLWGLMPSGIMMIGSSGEDESQQIETCRSFLRLNPDSVVQGMALARLTEIAKTKRDDDEWRRLYSRMEKGYGHLRDLRFYLAMLDPDKRIQVGKPMPDFSVTLLDGNVLTNHDLKGRYLLIDFWATWCAPCVAEMPYLHEAYREYEGKGLDILSLSLDRSSVAVERFLEKQGNIPWRHAVLDSIYENSIAKTFEVAAIPKAILVDPNGEIVALSPQTRGANLLVTLRTVLGAKEQVEQMIEIEVPESS